MIRIPYTAYRKPWISGLIDQLGIAHQVPGFFTLPLHETDILQLIEQRHNPQTIIELAHRASVEIPFMENTTRRLLESYCSSGLAAFHRDFYGRAWDPPQRRQLSNNDEILSPRLPPCARYVLANPNDWLLKPAGMQLITRCLLAWDWHPRRIASLIADRFLDPAHHWNSLWNYYDPVTRAEFYVRLIAGQIDQGLDTGIDFNCVSQQEKHFCWNPDGCSLDPYFARIYPSPLSNRQFP